MKLVQKPLTGRTAAFCASLAMSLSPAIAQSPNTAATLAAHYSPAEGFKPAQDSLTPIFLQLAGSLEYYGAPAPYIRHVQEEEQRIAEKYKAKTGRSPKSHRPAYMTDAYLEQLITNWNLLSPKLGLDRMAKTAGICARQAIEGAQGKGTVVIGILNQHQKAVATGMEGGAKAGFDQLQGSLSAELGFDVPLPATDGSKPGRAEALTIFAAQEKALTAAERKEYASLLSHARFTKAMFGEMDHFYKGAYDKLSDAGQEEMSRRVWEGIRGGEADMSRLDAITAALLYRSEEAKIYNHIEAVLPPETATKIKTAISSVFLDLGRLAQTEFELAMLESAAR